MKRGIVQIGAVLVLVVSLVLVFGQEPTSQYVQAVAPAGPAAPYAATIPLTATNELSPTEALAATEPTTATEEVAATEPTTATEEVAATEPTTATEEVAATEPTTATEEVAANEEDTPPLAMQTEEVPPYVPIMMYHYVREVDPEEDEMGYNLSIHPETFEQHAQWFQEQGYTTVRMETLARCLRGEEQCPEKPVALTFDDGYEDAFTNALPILERYDMTATFYIVTEFVGQPGYMTWKQIKKLHAQGMEIGSHTLTHADLTARNKDAARKEIRRSRTILREKIDAPVVSFCYPTGAYNAQVAEMVRNAGYTNAVTTYPGRRMDRLYEIPRRRLLGGETVEALEWYTREPPIEGRVLEDSVRVRAGPGTDQDHLAEDAAFNAGDSVTVYARSGGEGCDTWLQVGVSDNQTGWICGSFVQTYEYRSDIPKEEPEPAPEE